jgi:hypothetical protein
MAGETKAARDDHDRRGGERERGVMIHHPLEDFLNKVGSRAPGMGKLHKKI